MQVLNLPAVVCNSSDDSVGDSCTSDTRAACERSASIVLACANMSDGNAYFSFNDKLFVTSNQALPTAAA